MENTGFKGLAVTLYQRVFLSYKSTLVGLGIAVAGQVIDYYANSPSKIVSNICALAGVILALVKSKGLAAPPPDAGAVAAPKGTPQAALLGLLVLLLSAAPVLVRADSPKFGGCLANPKYTLTCFGPSVSLSLVSLDLKTGTLTTGVAPGIGYGMTWNTGRWYEMGISGYVSFRDTSDGQRLVLSTVGSFAEYVRIGIGQQLGGGARPFALLGVGANFGSSPSSNGG